MNLPVLDFKCCLPYLEYPCTLQSDGQTVLHLPSELRLRPFADNRFVRLLLLVLLASCTVRLERRRDNQFDCRLNPSPQRMSLCGALPPPRCAALDRLVNESCLFEPHKVMQVSRESTVKASFALCAVQVNSSRLLPKEAIQFYHPRPGNRKNTPRTGFAL